MMLRSQIAAAFAVLLVALGLVFVLVGDAGVATRVFLPEPTLTYTPTVGPTPTPLPEGNAGNWAEEQPGTLTYSDSSIPARILHETMKLDDFVQQNQLQPPPQPAPFSFLELLDQIRASLGDQAASLGLAVTPDTFTGPVIELVNSTPVALLRTTIPPQTESSSGQGFQGLDLTLMFIDRGGGEVSLVQYQLQGEKNLVAYNDFMAWLTDNMADLSGQAPETTGTPGTESATSQPAAGTGTPAPEMTGTIKAPGASATPQPPAATATPAPQTSATPSSAEGAAPQAAAESATPAPEANAVVTGTPVAPAETWSEIQRGQLINITNPNATIEYAQVPLSYLAMQLGMDTSGGAASLTPMDILNKMRSDFETQIAGMGIALDPSAIEGPVTEDFGGVPVSYIHTVVPPSTSSTGNPLQGQEFVLGLIDLGDGNLRGINLFYQGDPDPAIYTDFQAWLEVNAPKLAKPDQAAATPTGEATATPAD
ncbi:MAG TPA: hypothetical protein VMT24_03545 [Aggregatilineaceae bacterium]|nr:hypothetical protein [Aggregatilineaceae bacterium]